MFMLLIVHISLCSLTHGREETWNKQCYKYYLMRVRKEPPKRQKVKSLKINVIIKNIFIHVDQ